MRCYLSFIVITFIQFAVARGSLAGTKDKVTEQKPLTVRVLVINFDPVVGEKKKRLHEVCGWYNPRKLAKSYADDVQKASGGFIRYKIVKWRDVDGFPVKKDGFRYTVGSYMACREKKAKWHQPDLADYPKLAKDYGANELIGSDEIDELWIFGGPYFGFHESAMIGPKAFYINGGVYNRVKVKRRFAVMGFNYERGPAEMLHNLCHRTESTMTRVYGGWKADKLTTNWARFAANLKQSGRAGVGSCHYPPNGEKDYDYRNPRKVKSNADDWLTYPKLIGKTTTINCETWGGPDYHRNYMKWWFAHLPRAAGRNAKDGKLNNWYRYVFEFNRAMR